ncbi:hypothetical protein PVAP13_9NG600128 [Panicum virgatum]|uniref:Uncharacterized protein n=1 Tax=Panicum virgatum TaxID=38727 RepID=A0A8T0MX39_PANVG|nr:hypothetical protein PVAP13_9NG600128 [Panicum virgatum]
MLAIFILRMVRLDGQRRGTVQREMAGAGRWRGTAQQEAAGAGQRRGAVELEAAGATRRQGMAELEVGRRYLAHAGGRGGTDAAGPRGSHEVGWTASGGHQSGGEAAASKSCRAGAGCRQRS